MSTTTLLTAFAVPAVLCAVVALRRAAVPRAARAGDQRGIALQTVIIMVVLIVIAGGVSVALLNRGADVTEDLEEQGTAPAPGSYGTKALCELVNHTWNDSTHATKPNTCVPNTTPGDYTSGGPCRAAGHTWSGGTCS